MKAATITAILLLSACAAPQPPKVWVKDGATPQMYTVAMAKCRILVAQLPQNPADPLDNIAMRQITMKNCMVADGWELR